MTKWFAFLLLLGATLLGGCATKEKEKPLPAGPYGVPTYVPCQVNVPKKADGTVARPEWPDNYYTIRGFKTEAELKTAMAVPGSVMVIEPDGAVAVLLDGIKARDKWIDIVETALNGCIR